MQEEEIKETATEEEVKDEKETSEKVDKKENKKEKKDKHKEEIAKLEAKNKELEEKYAELKNDYLKAYAELENTKKRIKQEQITDRKYASQKVVGELIGPVDMLNMIINMPTQSPEVQNYVIGFQMITNQLVDILKAEGLGPINVKALDEFDPKIMQVVDTRYEEDKAENLVLEVKQAGYMYKDRVLRTAMVVVNKKPEVKKEVNEDVIENKE